MESSPRTSNSDHAEKMGHARRDRGRHRLGSHVAVVSLLMLALLWLYRGGMTNRMLGSFESPEVYLRLPGYMQEFAAGHWPPQVLPDAYEGGGYAFPRFYPPLAYWISSATAAMAGDMFTGINISFVLSVLVSGVTFYIMAVRMTGSILLALLGAVLYCVAPFRFLDIFLRGALAECWTFAWYPLFALGIYQTSRCGSMPWYLPASIGLLLLTHTVMALYAISFAFLYVLFRGLAAPQRLRYARHAVMALLLGIGLSAWHVLPARVLWDDVRGSIDGLMWSKPEQVESRAVPMHALLHVGTKEKSTFSKRVDSAFIAGVSDWALLPVTAMAIVSFLRRKQVSDAAGLRASELASALCLVALWLLAMAFVVKPRPALDLLPSAYGMVQFPWRLLGPATFFSATALVLLLDSLRITFPIRAVGFWHGVILAATIAAVLFPIPTRQGTSRTREMTAKLQEYSLESARRGYTVLGEYAPRTLIRSHDAVLEAAENIRHMPGIHSLRRNGSVVEVDVDSAEPLRVALPLLDYDFYDGRLDDGRSVQKYSAQGLVGLSLPPGKYTVIVKPHWSAAARLGGVITIVSVLIIAAMELRRFRIIPRGPRRRKAAMHALAALALLAFLGSVHGAPGAIAVAPAEEVAVSAAVDTAYGGVSDSAAAEREILRERAEAIRAGDSVRIQGATIAGRNVLPAFYERRAFTLAWTDPQKSAQLIQAIRAIEEDGLNPEDYLLSTLETIRGKVNSTSSPSLELRIDEDILYTEALVRLGYHVLFGKVDYSEFDPVWNFGREIHDLNPPVALQNLIDTSDLATAIQREKPNHPAYANLVRELAHYRALQREGGWGRIPEGGSLEPGSTDARTPAIRARLMATSDLPAANVATPGASDGDLYDGTLADGVKAFQARHGLAADGIVGPRTLEEMNVPIEARIEQLRLNLERGRWLLHDIGAEFVIVNVAGFRLYFLRDGKVIWTTRTQVGKTFRKTPVFRSEMTYLVLNPTWTVPGLLLREDILPQVRRDRSTLKRMNMKVLDRNGRVIDPATIDWSQSGRGFPYTLRQDPGPENALGRVKFMFPNEFAVYLHDTPHPELFDKEERAFSSGCIRVEDPLRLAELLLEREQGWARAEIDRVIDSGKTKSVTLAKPVPVLLSYWTAWVDAASGTLQFRRDLYGRDAAVLAGLNEPFRIH